MNCTRLMHTSQVLIPVCISETYVFVLLVLHLRNLCLVQDCKCFLLEALSFQVFQKNKCIYILFIYFWLHQVFAAAHRLSLVVARGGYSLLRCAVFSLRCLLLLRSTGSRHAGFTSCGTWAQQLWLTGSRAQAQQLWRMGLVSPRHVGSSRTRDGTRVPCIGRWILNHCATREAHRFRFYIQVYDPF